MQSKKRPRQSVSDKEKRLEDLVFGKDVVGEEIKAEKAIVKKKVTKTTTSVIALLTSLQAATDEAKHSTSVWDDEDDEDIEVDLSKTDRLRKLRRRDGNKITNVVSGTEFTSLLKERFQTRQLAWANAFAENSSKIGGTDLDILTRGGSMLLSSQGRGGALPQGRLDILRLVDANAESPSKKDINAIRFHPNGSLLLAAGEDKCLKMFRIDGEANHMQLNVRFNDMAIKSAEYLGGTSSNEVILGGRRPYFYSYDIESGAMSKVLGCTGKNIKSHEGLTVSPSAADGSGKGYIAIQGVSGYVHVMCAQQKTWITDVKIPSGGGVRAVHFLDENTLCASGGDAEVYVWDLRSSRMGGGCRVVQRFRHDDGTYTSSLTSARPSSVYSPHPYLAVGAESGVVSVFDLSRSASKEVGDRNDVSNPLKLKSVMNLTMKINAMAIHPAGELLAIGSDQRKDQLKLVHLPSCSVFSNWPTDRTPIGRVKCLEFSPGGAYFAQGDHRGRVTLHRLNHYTTA